MSRGFPTNVANALATQHVSLVTFVQLAFPSGTVYLHHSLGTYPFGGNDYLGVGDLGAISPLEEGADISPYQITLSLSGLDSTIAGAALTEDYYMHAVTVLLGVLNADDALLADPTVVFEGFMDQMNISVGADGGDVITLTAESELARFDKASNIKYTDIQLQSEFSGDLALEFMPDIEGAKIRWGDPTSDSVAGSAGSQNIIDGDESGRRGR